MGLQAESKMDSLIRELDKQIELSPKYTDKKLSQIESYKRLLIKENNKSLNSQYNTVNKIYKEYENFNSDSALFYAEKMLEIGRRINDPVLIDIARVNISFVLLSIGMFRESIDSLKSISVFDKFSEKEKINYNYIFARAYFDMADNAGNERFWAIYNNKGKKYLDNALSLSKDKSAHFYHFTGLKKIRNKEHAEAIPYYQYFLENFKLSNEEIAVAASSLAYLYTIKNETDRAVELLSLAAISDIKSSTKENVAMTKLSELLFNMGRIKEAYKYVKFALDEAYSYKANHRKLEIMKILPIIEGKQLDMVEQQRKTYLYYSISVTALIILVISFFVIILRQYKSLKIVKTNLAEANKNLQESNEKLQEANQKLEEANGKLEEVNKIKEEYIGSFFNMISENIESVEKFKQAISRKIKSNKPEEIISIIQNIDIDKERERLYKTFDSIFLKIFPGFVEKFNSLFQEEDHIELKEEQCLTPELRIFALIRLGIHETENIAKILRYAVRTIYTYKTKIKNKSIVPNEEFEERLLEIKAF